MGLQIVPLKVGHTTTWSYPETGTTLTFLLFAILGGPEPILVDTATYGPRKVRDRQGLVLRRPPAQHPRAALTSIGVDVADVRTIIQTHLHWDHTGNGALFPNAELVIQRDELRHAIAPPTTERGLFDFEPDSQPAWLADVPRMRPIDGDTTIAPGVRTLLLPGHTPGFQGILVETGDGPHLVAGDTVPSYAHWAGDETNRHLLGPASDPEAMHASFDRIEASGAILIPGHDADVLARGPFG